MQVLHVATGRLSRQQCLVSSSLAPPTWAQQVRGDGLVTVREGAVGVVVRCLSARFFWCLTLTVCDLFRHTTSSQPSHERQIGQVISSDDAGSSLPEARGVHVSDVKRARRTARQGGVRRT